MGKRVEKTRNDGTLSEKAFVGWLKTLMRKGSMRWRPKNSARKAVEDGTMTNPKTGRQVKAGKCQSCGKRVPLKDLEADHIDPCIPIGKTLYLCHREDFDAEKHVCLAEFAERLYTEREGWSMLCTDCHKEKTRLENEERKKRR